MPAIVERTKYIPEPADLSAVHYTLHALLQPGDESITVLFNQITQATKKLKRKRLEVQVWRFRLEVQVDCNRRVVGLNSAISKNSEI